MKIGKSGKVILTEDNELVTLGDRDVSDDEIRVDEAGPDTVSEPAREIPVAYDVDVIVAGGGISGVFAAIAAGRLGAKTLLIDRFGSIGGNMGPGMFVGGSLDGYVFGKDVPEVTTTEDDSDPDEALVVNDPAICGGFAGIPREFVDLFGYYGGGRPPYRPMHYMRDSQTAPRTAIEMLEEAGVEILVSAFVSDPIMEGDRVVGLLYEGKGGRRAARAKVVIDATGEADVARRAGAPAIYPRESYNNWDSHSPAGLGIWAVIGGVDVERFDAYAKEAKELYQIERREVPGIGEMAIIGHPPVYYGKLLYREEGLLGTRVQVMRPHQRIDASNAKHIAKMEIEVRKYLFDAAQGLKANVPGYENSYLMLVAPYLAVRGGPCIEGEYTLTWKDCLEGRRFGDVVYLYGETRAFHRSRIKYGEPRWADMPYRVMVPKKIDGLLAVGRAASGVPDTLLRNRMAVMHMGQVCGAAAALSVRESCLPRDLKVHTLQEYLVDQGFYLGNRARLRELKIS